MAILIREAILIIYHYFCTKNNFMLIAQKLRKENIAEYLLYMWQIEDLIRAKDLSIDTVFKDIIGGFDQAIEIKQEIKEWYASLIEMMLIEGVKDSGHLAINNNLIIQLTDLHLQLLKSSKHADYSATYYNALPHIVALRAKGGNEEIPEIETCFTALYGFLLMRMQAKEVSGETQAAITQISNLLRLLSSKFQQDQDNKLEF